MKWRNFILFFITFAVILKVKSHDGGRSYKNICTCLFHLECYIWLAIFWSWILDKKLLRRSVLLHANLAPSLDELLCIHQELLSEAEFLVSLKTNSFLVRHKVYKQKALKSSFVARNKLLDPRLFLAWPKNTAFEYL